VAPHAAKPEVDKTGQLPICLRDALFAGSALLIGIAVFTPNLLSDLRAAATQTYVPAYDATNKLAWQVFAERGLTPMKDFWYPYGNSLFLTTHAIVGPLLAMGLNLSEFFAFGWIFWRLSTGNRWATWLGVVGMILSEQFLPEFFRYSIAYLIPLLYWSIPSSASRRRWPDRVALALAVGGGLFLEPDPVLYGLLGLALTLGVEVVANFREAFGLLQEVAANLAPSIVLGILYLTYTVLQGQLAGLWDLYGQAGTIIAYSAYPTVLVSGLSSIFSVNGLIIWVPPVLLATGAYLRVKKGDADNMVARFLIGIAGCGFLLLEKDAVRPISQQIRATVFLASLTLLVTASAVLRTSLGSSNQRCRRMRELTMGGCVGATAAAIVAFPGLGVLRSGLEHLPSTIADDVHIISHPSEARQLEEEALAPARFVDYTPELQLAAVIKGLLGSSHHGLFVLGDDPSLYVILHQDPPWTVTAYNTSPVSDQVGVVRWLAMLVARVVVLDKATLSFDGVPSPVRIPLVYQAIIRSYRPVKAVDSYEILARLGPGQAADGAFWSTALGTQVDLGFIPDAIRSSAPAQVPGAHEVPYLRLQRRGGFRSRGVQVVTEPVRFGSVTVQVTLEAQPSRNEMSIPLSRIWAWPLSHRPTLAGNVSPAWNAHITWAPLPANQLY
jgi:hypothetical protein